MKLIKYIMTNIISCSIWTVIILYGVITGLLLIPITTDTTHSAFIDSTKERLKEEYVGNLALVLIEDGKVANEYYYSEDSSVNKHTVFQMASISKWVASWGIHHLVEEGKLDLDQPVNNYLTRWNLPKSEFNNQDVTVRNILSHTAGLVDGLGYGGFASIDSIQTLEESLTKAADGFWSDGRTRVGIKPNAYYKYSGGGYTLLQLLIEEVSGTTFNDYMTKAVFEPLKMSRSTYIWSDTLKTKLTPFYNPDSTIAPHYRYTALAAASLYTTPEDLALFLIAHTTKNDVLSKETIDMLRRPNLPENLNTDLFARKHGLGPYVFAQNDNGDIVFGHDGQNRNAINTAARLNVKTKDGFIAFESGNGGFSSWLGDQWIFWKTGITQYSVIIENKNWIISLLILGYLSIIYISIWRYKGNKEPVSN